MPSNSCYVTLTLSAHMICDRCHEREVAVSNFAPNPREPEKPIAEHFCTVCASEVYSTPLPAHRFSAHFQAVVILFFASALLTATFFASVVSVLSIRAKKASQISGLPQLLSQSPASILTSPAFSIPGRAFGLSSQTLVRLSMIAPAQFCFDAMSPNQSLQRTAGHAG